MIIDGLNETNTNKKIFEKMINKILIKKMLLFKN